MPRGVKSKRRQQLEALRMIRAEAGADRPIIWTVFAPFMVVPYLLRGGREQALDRGVPPLPAAVRPRDPRDGRRRAVQPPARLREWRALRRVRGLSRHGVQLGDRARASVAARGPSPHRPRCRRGLARQARHRVDDGGRSRSAGAGGDRRDGRALAPARARLLDQSRHAGGASARRRRRGPRRYSPFASTRLSAFSRIWRSTGFLTSITPGCEGRTSSA